MTALFLPDFVAYPACYLGLRRTLPDDASVLFVDYHDFWPYPTPGALADRIVKEYEAVTLDVVVGYSFGAHIALLVAEQCAGAGRPVQLVLLDPPLLATRSVREPAQVESLLRASPEYAYVFDLVEAGLATLDCVLSNVAMVTRVSVPRSLPAPSTIYVAGDEARVTALLQELVPGSAPVDAVALPHCTHQSVIKDPSVETALRAVALRGEAWATKKS